VWPSFGNLLEAEKDMVSCETKARQCPEDFFESAKHAKCAAVSTSPLLTIRWWDGDTDTDKRAKCEMWSKMSANLA
jgi:hypothetical protein